MIKRLATMASSLVLLPQLFVATTFAKLSDPYTGNLNGLANGGTNASDLVKVVVDILKIVLDLITILGVIFVIVAGIRLIVSGGDDGEKDKAKKTIIYVIIGILVVLFARVIVTFFANLV